MSQFMPPMDPEMRVLLVSELNKASQDFSLSPLLLRTPENLPARFTRYHEYLIHLPRRMRRALQRRWKRSLPALALLLALGQAPVLAATIKVTTSVPDIVAGSGCSLIEAIDNANDTVTGNVHSDCTTGDPAGADTVVLKAGSTHNLTASNNGNLWGDTGLPVITSTITIKGHGSTIKRAANAPEFRILAVRGTGGDELNAKGDLTLNETKVSGGVSFTSSSISLGGGGIFNYYGSLTLTNSTVSGNSAVEAGGIYNRLGVTTLTNSTVSGNSSTGGGGGVETNSGTTTLINSTVSGNSAAFGGGVFDYHGSSTLINSTFSGNRSTESIGGGGVLLYNSTVTLSHSLISGNTAPNGAELNDYAGVSTITANDFNLFGHKQLTNALAFQGFTPGASDINANSDGSISTKLSRILNPTLTRSVGTTFTHNLVHGSPAVDAVSTGCPPPASDQRGVPRPQGVACDIGAVELRLRP